MPTPDPVAATVDDLTPAWLSVALGRAVRAVRHERIGTGQIGATYRLHLTWDGPSTLVAKLASEDPAGRAQVASGYQAEVRFYTELASTVRVRTPRCWYGAVADDGETFTLLLDDLTPAVPGVQVDGSTPARAHASVENLAGLHGPRWCDPSLHQLGFDTFGAANAALLRDVMVDAVGQFVDRFGSQLTDADVATLHAAGTATEALLTTRQDRFSLLHGDYRLDNLMFTDPTGDPDSGPDSGRNSDGAVAVHAVDWQTLGVGLPGRDLGYFIGTCLDPAARRTHERDLVAAYHRALGVDGYDLATCWDDYRVGTLQGPLITVLGAIFATAERSERSDAMFLAMATRSCQAIRDLDALDLVEPPEAS